MKTLCQSVLPSSDTTRESQHQYLHKQLLRLRALLTMHKILVLLLMNFLFKRVLDIVIIGLEEEILFNFSTF